MNLVHEYFRNVDLNDCFFDSLKEDYKEFSTWFAKKAQVGERAYVFYGENHKLDGFLYLKVETDALDDVTPPCPPARRLKVGTMKINPHGTKLGERFLKKIFDHALAEGINEIYVTVFAEHTALIALYERYGFQKEARKTTQNGTEEVLFKRIKPYQSELDILKNYPLFSPQEEHIFLLSIYPKWHTKLFPDSILTNENASIIQDLSHTNSIHKVYLAGMSGLDNLKTGDVLIIYRTQAGKSAAYYSSVATSICVVEEYRHLNTFETLEAFIKYCDPYSVFSKKELNEYWANRKYPHVIRFTYNLALKKRITNGALINECGLSSSGYWGFRAVTLEQFKKIAKKGMDNENYIVDQT